MAEAQSRDTPQCLVVVHIGRYLLGQIDEDDFDVLSDRAAAMIPSVRFRALLGQMLAEAHCQRGNPRRALRALRRAAEEALVEVDWLRRCPSLEPIRPHPEFRRCADLVLARAAAIWRQ